MTSTTRPPPLMSWWSWRGWLPCWGRNTRIPSSLWPRSFVEGDPGVFLHGLMTVRRNGSINFFLKNLVLSSRGRKSFSFPTNSLRRNTWQGWSSPHWWWKHVFLSQHFFSPSAGPVMHSCLLPVQIGTDRFPVSWPLLLTLPSSQNGLFQGHQMIRKDASITMQKLFTWRKKIYTIMPSLITWDGKLY